MEGLCWYHLKGLFFQTLKVFCLIIVILFPQCVLLICIVYFRHPGYIYMVFRGPYDVDPLDPSVLLLQDRHRSHFVETDQVCILLFMN